MLTDIHMLTVWMRQVRKNASYTIRMIYDIITDSVLSLLQLCISCLRDNFVMRIRHIMTDVMANELQSWKARPATPSVTDCSHATQRRQAGMHCTVSKCTAKGRETAECCFSTHTPCTFLGRSAGYKTSSKLCCFKATCEQQERCNRRDVTREM